MRFTILASALVLLAAVGISSPVAASWYWSPNDLQKASAPALPPAAPLPQAGHGSAVVPGVLWGRDGEVRYVVDRINALRESQSLSPMALDPTLTELATLRLKDLLSHGAFTHDTPSYGTALQMERAFGLPYRVMGAENLAAHRSVAWAEMILEASPLHRQNLLYPDHTLLGLAIAHKGATVYILQLFGGR